MFASILAMAIAAAAPKPVDLPWIPHERYRLPNGLDVVLHDDDRYPLVAVRAVYHVGSMHDPLGKQGVAHLLEHTLASSNHLGSDNANDMLFRAGASRIRAFTAYTHTWYVEDVPANQLDIALWLESARMSRFDPAAHPVGVKHDRTIVIEEIMETREGGELALAHAGLYDLLFPERHPLHFQDRRTLERITVEDVGAMANRYYGPANATLILAGDLPDDTRARVERYFGGLSGGSKPTADVPSPELAASKAARVKATRSRVPIVLVAWPTPGIFAPGDAEADVLAAIIDARATESGIVTWIDADQQSLPGHSAFVLAIQGRAGATPSAMTAEVDAMLAQIAAGQLTDLEVSVAARRLATHVHRGLDTIGGRADRLAAYIAAGKPADWVAEDEQRFRRVTRAAVVSFARTWLHRRPRALVQIDPSVAGAK